MRFTSVFVLFVVACDCGGGGGEPCVTSLDCPTGQTCVDDACIPNVDGGDDAGIDTAIDGNADTSECETIVCDGACCREGQRCASFGCVLDLGPCETNDDCAGDSYCDVDRCTPYGMPPDVVNDPDCARDIEVGAFEPAE